MFTDQVLILENEAQLKKILQLPLDKLNLLAVVQYSGTMKKPDIPNISTKFYSVLFSFLLKFMLTHFCSKLVSNGIIEKYF